MYSMDQGRRADVPHDVDLVVIGGGSTGAAVLREATRAGLKALLVEKRDFAWGTSSRSTKLAQGGLRYLDTGDLKLVRESIRERDRLAAEGRGLVTRIPFTATSRRSEGPRRFKTHLAVAAYALLAGRTPQRPSFAQELARRIPSFARSEELAGAHYEEAPLDDARLVLRLIQEAVDEGAIALNYTAMVDLLRSGEEVVGVRVRDERTGVEREVRARAVVSATGVWANRIAGAERSVPRLRLLRGSHLLFPKARLPLAQGVSFRHPRDRRFVCALPWEDVVVVGTTDHDHKAPIDEEPSITEVETAYLLEAVAHAFPALGLTRTDAVSSFSGVRPIVDLGAKTPSDASREHQVFVENGFVTISGGKLTTCRAMARDALRALRSRLPEVDRLRETDRFLDHANAWLVELSDPGSRERLLGRYGERAPFVAAAARAGELLPVPGTSTLWAEVRWAARHESVVHLDDLLLRRVRLGLFLANGGEAVFARVRAICRDELGWTDARWVEEERAYRALWRRHYAVPHEDAVTEPGHAPVRLASGA